ncbi:uncharacterized protein [Montipora foliosa]|uniref:uncharacterized protein n=1 Tax=Montipora foliosa TaxID=591990 RepID=UPI0035F2193C
MAASVEASWEEVLSSIDNLLMETEIQDSNTELWFHEAVLLLNRLEMAVSILRALGEMDLDLDRNVYQVSRQLCSFLTDVYQYWDAKVSQIRRRTVTLPNLGLREMVHSANPGRPPFVIEKELLEDLRSASYTWTDIAKMLRISRWTLYRRVREYKLEHLKRYSDISDDELDELIRGYISRHGNTTGESYSIGFVRSRGLRIQRDRIRRSLGTRVDPENTALRWACVITRRVYSVPGPNSLWHIDGHHSLIRWKFVIHGCVDGFSRRVMYLLCTDNNRSETVATLSQSAAEEFGWPSRVRGDHGGENAIVASMMVQVRGRGGSSFIAGSSTRNQRIERLWREIFRCVIFLFYCVFYALEESGCLDLENDKHVFVLHYIFKARINYALKEFAAAFNNRPIRTENNWNPDKIWINGMINLDNEGQPAVRDPAITEAVPENIDLYGVDWDGPLPVD